MKSNRHDSSQYLYKVSIQIIFLNQIAKIIAGNISKHTNFALTNWYVSSHKGIIIYQYLFNKV